MLICIKHRALAFFLHKNECLLRINWVVYITFAFNGEL